MSKIKQFSITTNDGRGHGDVIGDFTVEAHDEKAAVTAAYRRLTHQDDFDTIVVSATPVPAPQEVTA